MYRPNPFGNPDGSRADLKEIEYSFITDFPFGIQINRCQEELLNKRVIVGAKGSGKTVYLRKIQSILKHNQDETKTGIYVDELIDQNMNCTEKVIAFCDFYERDRLSEKWTQAWKVAILMSLSHKILFDPRLSAYIDDEERKAIQKHLKSAKFLFEDVVSVYQCMSSMLIVSDTVNKMNMLLNNLCWIELFNKIQKIIKKLPPIYIFLDAIDIEYEHSPLHWTSCQKGLFYAIMALLQDYTYGEKLHLIMSMRDNVFTSILKSEHATKFSKESHIFTLDWDESNIKDFLYRKIDKLDDCYFVAPNDSKTVSSWLGISEIINERNETEKIDDFIFRHTRLVPRDIINLCNELAKLHEKITNNPNINISEWVKEIVLRESEAIGDELITICAKNIRINTMHKHVAQYGCSEIYTSDKYFIEGTPAKLVGLLSKYKNLPMTFDMINCLNKTADKEFDADVHLCDILWQNGALGFVDNDGKNHFYAQKFHGETLLPKYKNQYTFRSCINVRMQN